MAEINSPRMHPWGLWLVTGIVLTIFGLVLLESPVVTTIASVFVFGWLLILGGLIHIVSAILDRHSHNFWLHLAISSLAIVFGLLMLLNPKVTLVTLTLLIAAFFFSNGIFRILGSLITRFKGWGWYFVNGLISLLLGILIIIHWPASSLWVIGLFIGIDFLFIGISLIITSLSKREAVV